MITETALLTDKAQSEVNQAITLYERAQSIQISTIEDFSNAGVLLQSVKSRAKEIDDLRKSMTTPLDSAKKKIMDFFRPATDKLNDATKTISNTMIAWENEQERIRQEAQREAERLARERAETENLSLAAELERSGNQELAEQVINTQVEVVPVKVQSIVPRSAQAFSRETWSGECTNLMALVKAIAAGQAPISLVMANTVVINGLARNLKGSMSYPGIQFVSSKSMSSRRVAPND
jgi:hypothetical protein